MRYRAKYRTHGAGGKTPVLVFTSSVYPEGRPFFFYCCFAFFRRYAKNYSDVKKFISGRGSPRLGVLHLLSGNYGNLEGSACSSSPFGNSGRRKRNGGSRPNLFPSISSKGRKKESKWGGRPYFVYLFHVRPPKNRNQAKIPFSHSASFTSCLGGRGILGRITSSLASLHRLWKSARLPFSLLGRLCCPSCTSHRWLRFGGRRSSRWAFVCPLESARSHLSPDLETHFPLSSHLPFHPPLFQSLLQSLFQPSFHRFIFVFAADHFPDKDLGGEPKEKIFRVTPS